MATMRMALERVDTFVDQDDLLDGISLLQESLQAGALANDALKKYEWDLWRKRKFILGQYTYDNIQGPHKTAMTMRHFETHCNFQ